MEAADWWISQLSGLGCFKCSRWQLIDFYGTKLDDRSSRFVWCSWLNELMALGVTDPFFSFVRRSFKLHASSPYRNEWMPRPRDICKREGSLSSSFFIPRRIEFGNDSQHLRFQSKCFTVELNRKNDSNDTLREKGSKRLFLSKLDPPTSVREPRSHPRDTKREREKERK